MRFPYALLILGVVALACGGVTEPERETDAPLQTDRLSYSFTADDVGYYTTDTIELEITNTSGAPAYLLRGARRLALALEGLEDGDWVGV